MRIDLTNTSRKKKNKTECQSCSKSQQQETENPIVGVYEKLCEIWKIAVTGYTHTHNLCPRKKSEPDTKRKQPDKLHYTTTDAKQ